MAQARFTAMVEAIALKKDVKMTILVLNADDVLPDLLPMRAARVWIELQTEQPDLDDIQRINAQRPEQPKPQQLTFDETGFQVPAVVKPHGQLAEVLPMAAPADTDEGTTWTGPVDYVCKACGVRHRTLDGPCPDCGGHEFNEVPALLDDPEVDTQQSEAEAITSENDDQPPESPMVDCPDCGNLEPDRQQCKRCEGWGVVDPVPDEVPTE